MASKRIVSNLKAVAVSRNQTAMTNLARRARVSEQAVRALWHGYARRVDLHVLARLCEYLQCSITDILRLEDADEHDRA